MGAGHSNYDLHIMHLRMYFCMLNILDNETLTVMDIRDLRVTRRQFIAIASAVTVAPFAFGRAFKKTPADQVIRYDGWILRASDLQLTESEHA